MINSKVPTQATFSLTLNQQLKGTPVLDNPVFEYYYNWNFEKSVGIAMLKSINGTPVNITLHPLGIQANIDFMTDMEPTTYSVNASNDDSSALIDIVIYRVILDINLASGDRSGATMFNEDGSNIQASFGFSKENTKRNLPQEQEA
ncbi:MAG: hypothetical protein COB15_12980 [Flavobacteriales bacterium]|nr:MAG: hypothetical protein COB15_12980 [Flavobacteriales bacterium]